MWEAGIRWARLQLKARSEPLLACLSLGRLHPGSEGLLHQDRITIAELRAWAHCSV